MNPKLQQSCDYDDVFVLTSLLTNYTVIILLWWRTLHPVPLIFCIFSSYSWRKSTTSPTKAWMRMRSVGDPAVRLIYITISCLWWAVCWGWIDDCTATPSSTSAQLSRCLICSSAFIPSTVISFCLRICSWQMQMCFLWKGNDLDLFSMASVIHPSDH